MLLLSSESVHVLLQGCKCTASAVSSNLSQYVTDAASKSVAEMLKIKITLLPTMHQLLHIFFIVML
jgi:hypothetical protein